MKHGMLIPFILLFAFGLPSSAEEAAPKHNWHFSASLEYSTRSLDGTIVNRNALDNGAFGELIATGDSMNVGNSDGVMVAAAVQYKRFGLGLNSLPTSFEGQGSALVAGSGSNAGVFLVTPLDTRIAVNMLLANVYYNIVQTPKTVFGIGLGFGRTSIDLSIVPDIGDALTYDGKQPFGFLNLHFSSTYKRFLYGFALNGINGTFAGATVDYSDYKLNLGYRAIDSRVKLDIMGGYRLVNFAIDIDNAGDRVSADVSLEGPFLGVSFTY